MDDLVHFFFQVPNCDRMTEHLRSENEEARRLNAEDGSVADLLAELSIRLWSIDPENVTWSSGHAAICLVADLATASGGQLVADSQGTLIARFDRQETAVSTAKRLQKALYAFTANPGTACFAASIAIHRPDDQAQSGTLAVSDSLWSRSSPGQILVSGTVFETLQFTPGLLFRAPFAELSNPDFAYHELLWTDDKTLTAWQSRVDTASRSLQTEELQLEPEASSSETEPVDVGSLANLAAVRYEEELSVLVGGPFKNKTVWWIAGAVCLVLFAAIGIGMGVRAMKTHEVLQQLPKTPPPTPALVPPPTPIDVRENQPKVSSHADETGPKPDRVPPDERKVTHDSEGPVKEYDGFTSKQIPQLIRRAEADAGAGNYDDAKREYDIVLRLQPGNSAAQAGLRKLGMKIGGVDSERDDRHKF